MKALEKGKTAESRPSPDYREFGLEDSTCFRDSSIRD
jgi:hypothetical protein